METVRFFLMAIIAMGLALYIRTFFTKKAVLKVIEIFYQHKALTAKHAKTRQELGLVPHGFSERLTKPRDYKQSALRILVQRGIIAMTEKGSLYLVEEKLDPSLRGIRSTPRPPRRRS